MANLSVSINWKKNITFAWLLFVLLEDWKDWKVSGGISIGSDLPNDDNPTTAVPVVLRNNDFKSSIKQSFIVYIFKNAHFSFICLPPKNVHLTEAINAIDW